MYFKSAFYKNATINLLYIHFYKIKLSLTIVIFFSGFLLWLVGCFETGFYIAQAGLKLGMYPRLALTS